MKEFLCKLMIYIIIITVIYAVFSYLTLEISPLEWNWAMRAIFTVLILTTLAIFGDDDNNFTKMF